MALIFFFFLTLLQVLLVQCQSIQPPAIPLAVRSPYLQSYLPSNTGAKVPNNWPNFWTTNHTLGWSGLLRVDGDLYEWLGLAIEDGGLSLAGNKTGKAATLNSIQVTPTRSILSLTAGPMQVNFTFLSPIEPSDLVLQSFAFSYIYMDAKSTDSNSHSLQVYQDISAEWVSSDSGKFVQWNTTSTDSIIYHQVQRSPFDFMIEQNDMAEDAAVYHVTPRGSGVTFQTGPDVDVRSRFLNNGSLANTQDTTFRNINDRFPVYAFCNDLGSISSTSSPVVWGLGLVRDKDIIYSTSSGNQTRQPYFFTKYNNVESAMSDFMSDASNARTRAVNLDQQIVSDANKISSNYADLVSLASRQVMAGVEVTVGTTSSGKLNNSDVLMFMKDMGNSQRTAPVEVLYASFPAFLYLNATWAGYLLEPLLRFEESALYSQSFAAHDLGNAFPSAIGDTSPTVFTAMESTSDMLIMAWAHATFTGDGRLISQYYSTLKKWTDTLVSENPLTPNGFISADGQDTANMTNLAIKGIIGIRTMAEISRTLGQSSDAKSYSDTASSLVSQWQSLAGGSGHLASTYTQSGSWGLIYNLYPDKLFGFNLVSQDIYSKQTSWYSSEAQSAGSFGLPYDSNDAQTGKSHWTLLTAATVTDTNTRNSLVSMVHSSAANLKNFAVFPSTYNINDGSVLGGSASPAQGAMFALLAMNLSKQTISGFTPAAASSASSKSNAGAIAGGVVGGIAVIALVLLALFFYRRKRKGGVREYDDTEKGGFAMFSRSKKMSPSREPLDGYNAEPIVLNQFDSSHHLDQSSRSGSYHQSAYNTPSHYTPSSNESYLYAPAGNINNAQAAAPSRAPLHIHNGDDSENRPQAPPLPRKVTSSKSSGPPLTAGSRTAQSASSDAGGSSDVTADLRGEVENLRREMEEMRSRTAYEPPPEYQ